MKAHTKKRWTPGEDARVRAAWAAGPPDDATVRGLADALGRTVKSIRSRAWWIGAQP